MLFLLTLLPIHQTQTCPNCQVQPTNHCHTNWGCTLCQSIGQDNRRFGLANREGTSVCAFDRDSNNPDNKIANCVAYQTDYYGCHTCAQGYQKYPNPFGYSCELAFKFPYCLYFHDSEATEIGCRQCLSDRLPRQLRFYFSELSRMRNFHYCIPHYQCVSLDDNCDSCFEHDHNRCEKCRPGFYLHPETYKCLPFSGNCLIYNPDLVNCFMCTSNHTLTFMSPHVQCTSNRLLHCASASQQSVGCETCAFGYYRFPTFRHFECRSGSTLNCLHTFNMGCSACPEGSIMIFDIHFRLYTRETNPNGNTIYFCRTTCIDEENPEKFRNCDVCNNNTCIKCQKGYYLNFDGICIACSTGCLECDFQECFQCTLGFFPVATSCYPPDGSLSIDNCEETSQFFRMCNKCKYGFYPDNRVCYPCSSMGCETCSQTKRICFKCLPGRKIEFNQCIMCDPIYGCHPCRNFDCQCYHGFYLSAGDNPICTSCTTVNSQCVQCNLRNNVPFCVKCNDGFYAYENRCQPCSIMEGCKLCETHQDFSRQCTSCVDDSYYLMNRQCNKCTEVNERCERCYNKRYGGQACTKCSVGFYPSDSECLPCTNIGSCSVCDNEQRDTSDIGRCTECIDGFYLANSRCLPCIAIEFNCKFCLVDTNVPRCIECTDGFYLDKGCKVCSLGISGCVDCKLVDDVVQCLACSGTIQFLRNGTCVLCNELDEMCNRCENDDAGVGICTHCASNFVWNAELQKCRKGAMAFGVVLMVMVGFVLLW